MDRQWLQLGLLCGRGTDDAGWPGIAHTAGIDPSPYGGHIKKSLLKLVTRVHTTLFKSQMQFISRPKISKSLNTLYSGKTFTIYVYAFLCQNLQQFLLAKKRVRNWSVLCARSALFSAKKLFEFGRWRSPMGAATGKF